MSYATVDEDPAIADSMTYPTLKNFQKAIQMAKPIKLFQRRARDRLIKEASYQHIARSHKAPHDSLYRRSIISADSSFVIYRVSLLLSN